MASKPVDSCGTPCRIAPFLASCGFVDNHAEHTCVCERACMKISIKYMYIYIYKVFHTCEAICTNTFLQVCLNGYVGNNRVGVLSEFQATNNDQMFALSLSLSYLRSSLVCCHVLTDDVQHVPVSKLS